jgi:CBS domain containing-hemolysin-like protein
VATALGLLAIVVLVATNALFVLAEFSLTSVDRAKVNRLAAAGDRRAVGVQAALRELSFQLSGAQLGITVTSLLLGFIARPVLATLVDPLFRAVGLGRSASEAAGAVLALAVATLAQMLFGELVPQNVAIAGPLRTALRVVPVQRAFARAGRRVIALFDNTANAIVRGMGIEPQEELRAARTPGELGSLIGASAREGTLAADVAALLGRTLSFSGMNAGDVLTPRVQVVSLRVDQTAADLLDLAQRSGHSRFPVHTGDLDDVVGMVHVKHAFTVPVERRRSTPVGQIMLEPVSVPESLPCDDLLSTLRRRGLQLAVVVDEYGGTAGVVTLEDLVEELVGPVRDEHDLPETPPTVPLGDGTWSVSGLLRRDEFVESVGLSPPDGPYETLAGLVLDRLGRVPDVGDRVDVDGWHVEVTRMDGHRIDRVRLQAPAHAHRDPGRGPDAGSAPHERGAGT